MSEDNSKDLISQLMKETFNESEPDNEELGQIIQLEKHFDKRRDQLKETSESFLSDIVKNSNCEFSVVNFIEETQCYQVNFNGLLLDFPSNWNIFEVIHDYKKFEEFYCCEGQEFLNLLSPISSIDQRSSLFFIFGFNKVAMGIFEDEATGKLIENCISLNLNSLAA